MQSLLHRLPARLTALASLCLLAAGEAMGQPGSSADTSGCGYRACALTIVPVWNGLAVVRGDGRRVANLNFFLPRDITAALRGGLDTPEADSAAALATRAVRLRRAGAALTDLGLVALAVAAAGAARGDGRRQEAIVGAAGAVSLLVSIPLQFAADGALSRAVWWHNARYASR